MKKAPWADDEPAANGLAVRENFERWFKDSQVVDSLGQPMRLFHGTNADFDAFTKESIGSNLSVDKRGFFFSNCTDTACEFAAPSDHGYSEEDRWDGAVTVPVYLSLQNPLVMVDIYDAFGITAEDIFDQHDHVGEFYDWERPNILELADKLGCDGVFLYLEGFVQAVAFEPSQIKSAIGNAGLYLSDSPSMTDMDASLVLERAHRAKHLLHKADALEMSP